MIENRKNTFLILWAVVFCAVLQACETSPVKNVINKNEVDGFSKAVVDWPKCKKFPEYPQESRIRRETGDVFAQFLIDSNGKVLDGRITKSSGFPLLDKAVLEFVPTCHFKPATLNGQPVQEPSWADIRYTWRLDSL